MYPKLKVTLLIFVVIWFIANFIWADSKQMVVVPANEAQFVPVNPQQPDGPQIALLWGDPSKGPSAMFMKFKKLEGRFHIHSHDYHLIVLEGKMTHQAQGENKEGAKILESGSYWFQPANQPHADSCLTDQCVMFIKWEGPRDAKLAEDKF
jgi:quercetin dioxygenase-like cupin family protein